MTEPHSAPPASISRQSLTLAQYVEYRNGVPLGAPGSLQIMLNRSLGASTFKRFWQYWNPIWGYALGRYIFAPIKRFLPAGIALILTFIASGALHDLATTLVRGSLAFFFTPWFFLMSLIVVVEYTLGIDRSDQPFWARVAINLTYIVGCLLLTILITQAMNRA
ncbi:MAG: acyltransferase [Anaerolineaceae bacterium]|nr:acyltransferase [Anaerolineaceae bacterium]